MIAAAVRFPRSIWRRASGDAYTTFVSVLGVTAVLGFAVSMGVGSRR